MAELRAAATAGAAACGSSS